LSETALAIVKDYPQEKFNLLIPVKTYQEISPLHKMIINEVQISPRLEDKDVYNESGQGLALTKKGLLKLMAASNIQVLESKSVLTQKCSKCAEMARVTRQAPKCFECPYGDDVAYCVTIAVPEASGTHRIIKATKELRMEDCISSMTEAQYKKFKPFRTEQCESKALNRALREGLMVKTTYTAKELEKPFVVGLVMPNFNDPDLKKAMIANVSNNAMSLYGSQEINSNRLSLPQSEVIEIPPDEAEYIEISGEEVVLADIDIVETPADPNPEPSPVLCSDCGKELAPFTDRSKPPKVWSVQDTVDYSMSYCQRTLCISCAVKEIKAKQKAEKEGK
jgi:uncharacterized small protein (DUF1192 family)